MSQKIKAVLFDKDGTLFQFEATWGAWVQGVVRELAPEDSDRQCRLAAAVGYDLQACQFAPDSLVIAASGEQVLAVWCAELPQLDPGWVRDVCERHEHALPLAPCCDLHEMVSTLRALGMKLGVATNDFRRVAIAHLDEVDLTDSFDCIFGCDSGHGAKPDPGMLLAFCSTVGVTAAETVMVGDSTRDLQSARNAGFGVAVGVLTGPAERAELAPLADTVLESAAELPAWLSERAIQSQ